MNVPLDTLKPGNAEAEIDAALGDQPLHSDERPSNICCECDAPVPPGEWWCATCHAAYKREMER